METPPQDQIAALAELYDRFAYSTDRSAERQLAEQTFNDEVAAWYDSLGQYKPSRRDFNREVISRCKKHIWTLRNAPPSLPPSA